MRISSYVIAVLIIGLTFILFNSLINDLAGENGYDIMVNDSYYTDFDKTTNISERINADYHNISEWSVDSDSYLGLVPEVVSLLKNTIVIPFTVTEEIISTFTTYLQLDDSIYPIITSIVLVIIVFALLAIILRYKYT